MFSKHHIMFCVGRRLVLESQVLFGGLWKTALIQTSTQQLGKFFAVAFCQHIRFSGLCCEFLEDVVIWSVNFNQQIGSSLPVGVRIVYLLKRVHYFLVPFSGM